MEPRAAATVIVARPAEGGVEVLVERRHERSRFAPGFIVFPGGTIDRTDRDLARQLFGDAGDGARACALRELYEEVGILLTASGPVGRKQDVPFADLEFDPPSKEAMPEVARWVAPEFLEVRFDARFFAAAAPRGLEPRPDDVETDRAWWAVPEDVLADNRTGEAPLMWPTLVTLQTLSSCRTVEDVLALRMEQVHAPEGWRPGQATPAYPEGRRDAR